MKANARYAIYYAPHQSSALAKLGAAVLGYDASSGSEVPFAPALAGSFPGWRGMVAEPARYGFHATLKAPFELKQGVSESNLTDAVSALAAFMPPLEIGRLEPAAMGSFIALVPSHQTAIRTAAGKIVASLDHLRAPLTVADRKRRLSLPLTERQTAYLERWGYPFVFEEYRFHMTLTGSLTDATHRDAVQQALQQVLAAVREPVVLDALTVFRQHERTSSFKAIARCEMANRTG